MTLFDHTGVIHFHSSHSFDGRVPVPDIIDAAARNGLDFLMLTDHSTLAAKDMEGWHGKVLLVVGFEISPRFNHYLAFNVQTPFIAEENREIPPQTYIDFVKDQGGFGFLAHPDHEGTAMFHVKHYPWVDWSVKGFCGMGIWDFMTDWQATLTSYPRALLSYLFPAHVLKGPKETTLRRWDAMTQAGKVPGIGELDNHETLFPLVGLHLKALSFRRAFKLIHTHIVTESPLTGDSGTDVGLLLKALKEGRAYVALEYFRSAKGFSFTITDGKHEATMGDDFRMQGETLLRVTLPARGDMRIVRDGTLIHAEAGKDLTMPVRDRGTYRVEVYLRTLLGSRPWIFSNPVYVA